MTRETVDFIKDITDSIDDIEIFVKGFDFGMFCDDRKTIYAVIRVPGTPYLIIDKSRKYVIYITLQRHLESKYLKS